MDYVCLVYFEPEIFGRMSESERRKLDIDSLAYDADLEKRGHLIAARALQPAGTAVTVKVRGSNVSSTDGPFAEAKEHLGGFILISAADLDQARAIAAGIPLARYGKIELRAIYDIPGA